MKKNQPFEIINNIFPVHVWIIDTEEYLRISGEDNIHAIATTYCDNNVARYNYYFTLHTKYNKDAKTIGYIAHEVTHIVDMISEDLGIELKESECRAYLSQFYIHSILNYFNNQKKK